MRAKNAVLKKLLIIAIALINSCWQKILRHGSINSMQCIQTGGVYRWWEEKYGRPYPISGLELHSDFTDDHLQNWLKLLRQKTLDEVEATCAYHLEIRALPLDKGNLAQINKEILEKIRAVFEQTVKQAILEDPIANSYYEKWSPFMRDGYEKIALGSDQTWKISERIDQYLESELDKNRQAFWQVMWQRVTDCFENLDLIPLYKD